jgi:hypothetical protein
MNKGLNAELFGEMVQVLVQFFVTLIQRSLRIGQISLKNKGEHAADSSPPSDLPSQVDWLKNTR